jgi:hypothetical protein
MEMTMKLRLIIAAALLSMVGACAVGPYGGRPAYYNNGYNNGYNGSYYNSGYNGGYYRSNGYDRTYYNGRTYE